MSTTILRLSENGELQRIHDKWLMSSACSSQGSTLEVDRLKLKSFWGLFLVCGIACLVALLIYFVLMVRQFIIHFPYEGELSRERSSMSGRLKTFLSFADEKEEDVLRRSKIRQLEKDSNAGSMSGGSSMMNGSRSSTLGMNST